MSNTITTAFVRQFNSNVIFLYQQRGSKLRGKMREKPTHARYDFFDRIAATAAVKKTVRHGNTPLVNTQHTRRRAEMVDYEWADLIDKQDEIRLLIQPTSAYAQNAAMSMGRAYDDEAILAFIAAAREGETGATSTAFPTSTQQIAAGGVGLTVDKLRTAKVTLDGDDVPDEGRWVVVSPIGLTDLLEDTQVTSSDFNTVRALVNGDLNTYMGLSFVKSTRLPISTNDRDCYVWHVDSMGMIVGMDFTSRVSERDDKGYSTQVYTSGTFGGVRVQDLGVVQVIIDESV